LAFVWAKIEISAEGANGYAEKFPCKRWYLKGLLKKLVDDRPYITEYHIWMAVFLLLVFHFPHWFSDWKFWKLELFLLGLFFLFLVLEDFLWFLLNPAYGLKKFNKGKIWWHPKWIGKVPSFYPIYGLIGLILIFLSQII